MPCIVTSKHNGYQHFHKLDENFSPAVLDWHCHQFYEIFYHIDGDVDFLVEGHKYHLEKNTLLIMRPMEFHSVLPRSPAKYERFVINFKPEDLLYICLENQMLAPFWDRPAGKGNLFSIAGNHEIQSIFSKLACETGLPSKAVDSRAEFLLGELLVQILQLSNQVDIGSTPPLQSNNALVNAVVAYIGENITQKLTLSDLAEQFFVSKQYLSRLFKRYIGAPVNEYITHKKIGLAVQLLTEGGKPTAVAQQCGFTEYSTFFRAFKRILGKKPEDYKS